MFRFRCWSVENLLDLFVDGRLAAARAGWVRVHLEACASCRAQAQELEDVRRMLRAQASSPAAVPEGLADAILEAWEKGGAPAAGEDWTVGLREMALWSPARALALAYLGLVVSLHALPGAPSQGLPGGGPGTALLEEDR